MRSPLQDARPTRTPSDDCSTHVLTRLRAPSRKSRVRSSLAISAPALKERWQIGVRMPRPARRRAFTVIAVPATLVLVWDVAPAEIRGGLIRYHAKGLQRINAPRPNCAQMLPLVPKIEHVCELLTGTQSAQGHAPVVEQVLRVVILVAEDPQTVPVGTRELVQ